MAQAQFDEARREHEQLSDAIESERAALDKREEAENARWEKAKHKLEGALRRARD